MSVRLQVSYSTESELQHFLQIIQPIIFKIGKERKYGEYYRRDVWLAREPKTDVCIFPANML